MTGYDIIGDIHGCADKLEALLKGLGYRKKNGCFSHPRRRAVFVGDFIDRGRQNFNTLRIVKAMVENGQARAVMGNHEYNALCYHTRSKNGTFLRAHNKKNIHQHRRVLEEIERHGVEEWNLYLDWFMGLPLCLELEGLRLVHACWDEPQIRYLKDKLGAIPVMSAGFLRRSARVGTPEFTAVDMVLKGREVKLPEGLSYEDKDGYPRHRVRVKWWLTYDKIKLARSFADLARAPARVKTRLQPFKLPWGEEPLFPGYNDGAVPVFFGHYWYEGKPRILLPWAQCLDYSAVEGGYLCAYRWSGERRLKSSHLFYV